MRHIPTIFISLFFSAISCDNPKDSKPQTQDTPKALEEKNLSEISEISSKRGYDNLVDNIYEELVNKSPELKNIESEISRVHESTNDSLSLFHKYDGKNQQYYSSSNNHLSKISDSGVRQQIKILLDNSLKNYKTSTQRHNELIKTLDLKSATLNDIHILLKLYKTLPIIEDYQKKKLPGTTPIENLIDDYNKTIQKTESLTKKQNGS